MRSVVTSITHLAAHVAGPVHVQLHVSVKLVLLGKGLLAALLGSTEIIKYSRKALTSCSAPTFVHLKLVLCFLARCLLRAVRANMTGMSHMWHGYLGGSFFSFFTLPELVL